jgi:hypothetical protein
MVHASDSVSARSAKSMELEGIEARLRDLESAAEAKALDSLSSTSSKKVGWLRRRYPLNYWVRSLRPIAPGAIDLLPFTLSRP